MDLDTVLKPNEKFVFRDIAGETILVPVRAGVSDLDSIFTLNETGALVWKAIQEGAKVRDIVGLVRAEFEIEASTAEDEVKEFLDLLMERELIESAEV